MAEIEKNSIFKTKDASGNILIHYFKTRIENLIGGPLGIDKGGTGQTTAAAARNALGLGNTTGALPIANGGTGAASASAARTALGITPANIAAVPTTRKVNGKALSADVTLTAPDVGARAGDWLPTLPEVGGSNINLFRNPELSINQRGITSINTSGAYFADGWKHYLTGTMTTASKGWNFDGNSQFAQETEYGGLFLAGAYVTVSLMLSTREILSGTGIFPAYGNTQSITLGDGTKVNAELKYNADHSFRPSVLFKPNVAGTVIRTKFELGKVCTMANEPLLDPQQGLAKCQRYLQHLDRYSVFVGGVLDANTVDFYVPLPVAMRVSPTVINGEHFQIGGMLGFTVSSATSFNNASYLRLRAVKQNHGISTSPVFIEVNSDDIFLSSEM